MISVKRILFAVAKPDSIPSLSNLSSVPPVGLLAIAGYTRIFFPKVEMQLRDFAAEDISIQNQIKAITSFSPDIVALSARSFLYPSTVTLAKNIKKSLPNIKIVLGGQHVTLMGAKEEYPDCFDTVVVGEGEKAFVELLKMFEMNEVWPKSYSCGYLTEISHDYAWDILYSALDYKRPYTPLYTDAIGSVVWSRGCPFNCFFCSGPALWKGSKPRVRYRTPESIANELAFLVKKYRVRRVFIHDDTLNADINKLTKICEFLIKRKIKVFWAASGMRADASLLPERIFPLLWDAGCRYISFGVESGSPKILKKIRRRVTHNEVERAFVLSKKYGFKTCGGFSIGHVWENSDGSLEGETEKDLIKTIEYIKSLMKKGLLWSIQMSIISPIPGSPLYKTVCKKDLLYTKKFDQLAKYDRTSLSFKHPNLTSEILSKYYNMAYRLVALNPNHILKLFLSIRSIYDLIGLCRTAFFVFKNRLLIKKV